VSAATEVSLLSVLSRTDRSAQPDLSPPPRFLHTDFTGYRPAHPSQALALQQLQSLTAGLREQPARRGLLGLLQRRPDEGRGLYLDGGFGVGKTHLLAATFHAAEVEAKAYLSFQELVHQVGVSGISQAAADFAGLRLLCLDEFELDDPGNTLIVKKVLEALFAQGTTVVTTSNTPASAQGEGRFNAADFRREIQGIADRFDTIRLDGPDWRARQHAGQSPRLHAQLPLTRATPAPVVTASQAELFEVLRELHPAHYGSLLSNVGTLVVTGLDTIGNQNDALRFVHFVDRLYDRSLTLHLSVSEAVAEQPRALFHPSYRDGAYQKKHDRCISRLLELASEAVPPLPPHQHQAEELVSAD